MKNLIIILISILCATGCGYNVDNSDVFKVADAIHESFKRGDSTILKKIFINNMDSISIVQRNTLRTISQFYSEDLEPMKIDTSSNWLWNNIDLYYRKNNQFFRIRAGYYKSSTNSYYIDGLYFHNIGEQCEVYNNEPYCPKYSIDIKRISWTTDYYNKTFKSGSVELQNNLDKDINYIKFRVILKNGEHTWSSKTFLNQTVESYKPIFKGDIVSIDIPGMTDYFIGFPIDRDKLTFTSELIEVGPKPESFWCSTLEELRELALLQTN